MTDDTRLKRLADFLFEAGMLRKTPRTGFQFLGSGQENVAEHSFRTAVIGYVLAGLAGADRARTVLMCLFHDMHETRVGDFNYVNRIYNTDDAERALRDALQGTGLTSEILPLFHELEHVRTGEAALAQDADQLDLILNLKQEQDLGNPYAGKWMDCAVERLRTDVARQLVEVILVTDHTSWWFDGQERSWWVTRNGSE